MVSGLAMSLIALARGFFLIAGSAFAGCPDCAASPARLRCLELVIFSSGSRSGGSGSRMWLRTLGFLANPLWSCSNSGGWRLLAVNGWMVLIIWHGELRGHGPRPLTAPSPGRPVEVRHRPAAFAGLPRFHARASPAGARASSPWPRFGGGHRGPALKGRAPRFGPVALAGAARSSRQRALGGALPASSNPPPRCRTRVAF